MAIPYLNSIDLNGNEIQNVLIHKLAAAPASPVEGQIYHNTTDHKAYMYSGSAWVDITSAGTGDVTGPGSATDGNLAAFDGAGGKTIKDSLIAMADVSTVLGYVDQDVGSGSSPTLDGANMTGIDAANVDIADSGSLITATDVEAALQEIFTAVAALPTIYAANVGNGADTALTVNHSLGTRDVLVQVRDNSSPYDFVLVDVEATDTNNVTLRFATAPTSNQYRCIVMG